MQNSGYILKSSKEEIFNTVKKGWVPLGTTAEEVTETLFNDCDKTLLKNLDEIVQNVNISDIEFSLERKTLNGKSKTIVSTLNQIYKDFYQKIPMIIILFSICLEAKGEPGFLWLHNSLQ